MYVISECLQLCVWGMSDQIPKTATHLLYGETCGWWLEGSKDKGHSLNKYW